jgi:hypothetical protein
VDAQRVITGNAESARRLMSRTIPITTYTYLGAHPGLLRGQGRVVPAEAVDHVNEVLLHDVQLLHTLHRFLHVIEIRFPHSLLDDDLDVAG